jgi:hypothetical protein
MLGRPIIGTFSAALFACATVMACSGGAPPAQTNVPVVRAVPPQPVRDASGQILTTPIVLPEGTEFTAQTLDFLSSETAADGDPVRLEVENNVVINGAIAIAAGSRVKGVVSSVTHASRMGKSGNISLRVEGAEAVDGQRVRLRASNKKSTDDKLGSTVALTVVLSPLFLLRKGNDVAYQPGTRITVFTDDKLDVRAWRQ